MNTFYMEFHFKNDFLEEEVAAFADPIDILQTNKQSEVLRILNEVESYINKGYYAAGYISYEASPAFQDTFVVHPEPQMPLICFGIFKESLSPIISSQVVTKEPLKWDIDTTQTEYEEAISFIHHQIELGNTYQTNYTVRLHSHFGIEGHAYFQSLRKAQDSNYSAYLNTGEHEILSASPELFFAWNGCEIVTRPMKGTISRGLTYEEDIKNRNLLLHSKKDQAENVMIVDLLRNDLSRVSRIGSVHAKHLFNIEAYPTIYQMTSTVVAKTRENTTLTDIFGALFPCGSITGAPKVSTMKIINHLEKSPREVYCGAIGYIKPNKVAVFNVPIRTVWVDKESKTATYGVGGGITWDSTAQGEYEEIRAKGKVLMTTRYTFDLIESFLLEKGQIYLLDRHMNRLRKSANYFQFQIDEKKIRTSLETQSKQNSKEIFKIRLLVKKDGEFKIDLTKIEKNNDLLKICNLSIRPISKNNLFLYHKTTERSMFSQIRNQYKDYYDTLLWNEDQNITEFTTGNVVCKLNGILVTPPVKDGLLAGTFREALLNENKIKERSVSLHELNNAEEIWFINSVRGWIRVTLETS